MPYESEYAQWRRLHVTRQRQADRYTRLAFLAFAVAGVAQLAVTIVEVFLSLGAP